MKEVGDVDAAFDALGPLGRYNLVQFFFLLITAWPVAFNMLSIVFQGQSNPFQCAHYNYNLTMSSNTDYPKYKFHSSCKIEVTDHNSSFMFENGTCSEFDVVYELPKDRSFVSEFNLVCDREYLIGMTQTVFNVGQLIGVFAFPYFADRYGRRPVYIINALLSLLSALGIACSFNYEMLLAFKALLGFFEQGSEVAIVSAAAEICSTRYRAPLFAFGGALSWALACLTLAPMSYVLREYSWKIHQFAICGSYFSILVAVVLLDESLRWLSVNGKTKEVMKILEKASRWNNVEAQHVKDAYLNIRYDNENKRDTEELSLLTEKHMAAGELESTTVKPVRFVDLFTNRLLRAHTIFVIFAWFFNSLTYYALVLMSSTLHGDLYLNFSLSIVVEFPAAVYCHRFLDKFGRRKSFALFSFISGVFLIGTGLVRNFAPDENILLLILTSIGRLGVTGSFTIIYMYTPELFPTNVRNMGMGVGYLAARIGGMIAPYGELLMKHLVYAPGLLMGISNLMLSVAPYFLPETTGRQLPQTLDDIMSWKDKNNTNDKENKLKCMKEGT